jgi:hypothetical protein
MQYIFYRTVVSCGIYQYKQMVLWFWHRVRLYSSYFSTVLSFSTIIKHFCEFKTDFITSIILKNSSFKKTIFALAAFCDNNNLTLISLTGKKARQIINDQIRTDKICIIDWCMFLPLWISYGPIRSDKNYAV